MLQSSCYEDCAGGWYGSNRKHALVDEVHNGVDAVPIREAKLLSVTSFDVFQMLYVLETVIALRTSLQSLVLLWTRRVSVFGLRVSLALYLRFVWGHMLNAN